MRRHRRPWRTRYRLPRTVPVHRLRIHRRERGPRAGSFFRLFMQPGVFHCGGGVGPGSFEPLLVVIGWVERGAAPGRITAALSIDGKTVRTRPLCPYPQKAKYQGSAASTKRKTSVARRRGSQPRRDGQQRCTLELWRYPRNMTNRRLLIAAASLLAAASTALAVDVAPPAEQIASSLLAAPAERRAGATVLGYNGKGEVVTLREGTNDLICLADDPAVKGISVACYHKELEPFMARGRELAAKYQGKERHERRWKEVDEGKLKMPREPRMLYVLTGSSYDAAKGELADSYLRWVVYTPYATPESTGLSTKSGTAPWLMYPGTAGAHIMISPPKEKK